MTELYLSPDHINRFRNHCRTNPTGPLVTALKKKADPALGAGPFTVMDKTLVPPTGDKHDFLRMPTYAWPNPDTPDGLPYIIKDGQAGSHINGPDYDMGRMGEFTAAVTALGWAYLATGEEKYASHAVSLLRTWFIDPASRMNPNMTFSKYTPGDEPPYATGVIAGHRWPEMLQAVTFLEESEAWTGEMTEGLRGWFAEFLEWLQTSHQGLAEKSFKNNRGTWYEVQRAVYARFAGQDETVRDILQESCPVRLDHQVAGDGSMPEELRRTISLNYTVMTLHAWGLLALMGERLDADLWNRTFENGHGLRTALDYTLQYLGNPGTWPHQQIKDYNDFTTALFIYGAAADAYGDAGLIGPLISINGETWKTLPASILFNPAE